MALLRCFHLIRMLSMSTASVVVSVVIAVVAIGSAAGKLTKQPKIIESLKTVGLPDKHVNTLAILEILGAAGVLIGLKSKPLGVISAIALALYFIGAVIAHVRANDAKNAPPAAVLALIAIAAAVLRAR